ncbi:hypothetical protein [Sphingobium yanoikuyae]|uniref:hypothetical protein n=1 Tax=Sphingobium yanoikuyae TaxID=13690 RepID=UPI0022DE570C|nr:hypothetical protein [Sphingobium yanoikuyae]WBQ17497.1 hypothetical protein PAE53_04630 [Sphingobium yanoikuyae]
MEMNHPLSNENGKRIIAETLRLFVGQGRSISWDDLGAATGEKPGTLRTYAATPPVEMSAPLMMRVFAALPTAAWAKVNAAMGFCAPPRIEDEETACMRRTLAQLSHLVADGNEYLADGVVDHREQALFSSAAEAMIPALRAHIKD